MLGLTGFKYTFVAVNPSGSRLASVLSELEKGTVSAVIDSEYDLEDAKAAYERLETGRARGKVVVRILHGDEAGEGKPNPTPPDAEGRRTTLFNAGLHCEGCANGVKKILYKVRGRVLDSLTKGADTSLQLATHVADARRRERCHRRQEEDGRSDTQGGGRGRACGGAGMGEEEREERQPTRAHIRE